MILWIVLGVLISMVATFLVVASILDRKKSKKRKLEFIENEKKQKNSKGNVAIWINITRDYNKKLVDNFVPSIGKIKMSHIKQKAQKSLKKLANSEEFEFATKILEESDNKESKNIKHLIDNLQKTSSNLWEKKLKKELAFFHKIEKDLDQEKYKLYKSKATKQIKEVYK